MLTPSFDIQQNEEFVILNIRVPYVKVRMFPHEPTKLVSLGGQTLGDEQGDVLQWECVLRNKLMHVTHA